MAEVKVLEIQSQGTRDIFDVVDCLRSHGISQYIDLPQIIVCGDQSSGKSSVLEAISGMAFPTKDVLCTRFATELILRRTAHGEDHKISILPGPDRGPEEREALAKFRPGGGDLDLSTIVESAKDVMARSGTSRVFYGDILRVELSSPSQPHLTLVDLPGLFLAGNRDQTMEDAKLVESLVLSYMSRARSIILAVVSAKSEFALQQVTQRAREVDPDGRRTLGLITKPDTLHRGSESERTYVRLAQNTDVTFRLGWHVVVNRDFQTRHYSIAERNEAEASFLSGGVWASLSQSQKGIDTLRARLGTVLHDQILEQMPSVLQDINDEISVCQSSLGKLGMAREKADDQRRYLLQVSQSFTGLARAAVDGDYSNRDFFGQSTSKTSYDRRLRAQIQSIFIRFAETMRLHGHAVSLVDTEPSIDEEARPRKMLRSAYVKQVRDMIRCNRGRELPGTFNPLLVGEMFSAQCQPWRDMTWKYCNMVLASARTTLLAALNHVTDGETAARINRLSVEPRLLVLEDAVKAKLDELIEPHTNGHPITYNHYLTENVQKAQQERHDRKVRAAMERHVDTNSKLSSSLLMQMAASISNSTQPNMEDYASTLAIDLMEAYYKVAMKRYIDDVCVIAVEQCLVKELPSTMPLDWVVGLSEDELSSLVNETPDIVAERARLAEKLKILKESSAQLIQQGVRPMVR